MTMKIVKHTWNVLSGVFVLFLSLWMSGPGIGETDTPTYRWYFMLLFILWGIGLFMQFKDRTKLMGIIVTFIPVGYYLIFYILVVNS
ncbi:hypothetical protein F7888_19355 [Bacillus sp. PS06]|nr:hypothetical protein [Bacillus sp. PS06]